MINFYKFEQILDEQKKPIMNPKIKMVSWDDPTKPKTDPKIINKLAAGFIGSKYGPKAKEEYLNKKRGK